MRAQRNPSVFAGAMLPLAHAGHYVLWFLYLPPIVIVLISLTRSKLNERRDRRRDRRS